MLRFDRVEVTGNASLSDPGPGAARTRKLYAELMAKHAAIPANKVFDFLRYATNANFGDFTEFEYVNLTVDNTDPSKWHKDKDGNSYWLQSPNHVIAAVAGNIGGKLWDDSGAVAGVFEPGEALLANRVVRLFDEEGNTQLASTTTDANGEYQFAAVAAGIYVVEFDRPSGERFAAPNATTDDLDSDPDPLTGRVRVDLSEDIDDLFAGYDDNAAPIAVDDVFTAHKNSSVGGNVLGNDTDEDGDDLTAALASGPANGDVTLNSDGSFTYTPDADFTGTDTFTYTVSDDYEGSDTGTVTITVANTPAPVGVGDGYSAPADLFVTAAAGVLANDTGPSSGTLTAVLVTGPAHGALALSADGSFSYTPDDDFTGTDSFTYRPADADGPGNLTTVSITVTDRPPAALADAATTDEDTAVAVTVLANDTDPDSGDTLSVLGASDGIFGTTAVNPDGTITYTPEANFNGTDSFTYVIDDGHGRLSFATVTVVVTPVNDAPVVSTVPVLVQLGEPRDIDLRTLASDVETPPGELTFTVGGALNGTVALLPGGYIARFTPAAGYYGPAYFTVGVTDPGDGPSPGGTTSGGASVAVNAPPQVMISAPAYHLAPGQTVTFYAFFSDPDGDPATLVSYTQPSHGSAAPDVVGYTFSYTAPTTPFVGTTTFTITASDGRGGVTTATATIVLTNEPPVGADVSLAWSGPGPIAVDPMGYDPDADPVTVTSVAQPAVGTVVADASGWGVAYLPPDGFTGVVTFSYTVDDGHGGTTVIHVTITVT